MEKSRIEALAKLGERVTKEWLDERAVLRAKWEETGSEKARDAYLAFSGFTIRKVS